MDEELFSVQIYTPGSDFAVGFNQNQFISGRDGNEALLGLQPENPFQPQIDIFNGDLEIPELFGGEGRIPRSYRDRFILGDFQESYYDNGDGQIFGLNDFGLISDFNPAQDIAQLNGTPADYQLLNVGFGQALLKQGPTGPDVIGFFLGNTDLDLGGNYFQFEGNTPPRGLIIRREQQFGTEGFELSASVATDPLGNVYAAGGTTRSLGAPNNGDSRDALVSKFDSQGNLLFPTQFGSSDFDTISGIDTDAAGNFYTAGVTEGTLEDPKESITSDGFLAKFDSNGAPQFIEQFARPAGQGQSAIFQPQDIEVDDAGNSYISGLDVTSADEPGNVVGPDDPFVTKFDTNGDQQWFTPIIGSENFDESYNVTVANDGSVYATGFTTGDFAQPNAGLYDVWLAKFDNLTGNEVFRRQLGSSDYEWSWGVDTDSQGNIYTTGWTLGTLDTLGGQNAGLYDAYFTKFSPDGTLQFVKQFGTAGDDQAFRININENDDIFLTGYTDNNLGGTNAGDFDAFVAKFDTNGNQLGITQFGTPKLDEAYSITSDNGNVYVTGITEGSLGAANAGSVDGFVAKLDANTLALQDFTGISGFSNQAII